MAGAKEVALSVTAGMLTTVIVLLPVMGSSGYTSRVLRPLNMVLFTTLAASLVAALTIIPSWPGSCWRAKDTARQAYSEDNLLVRRGTEKVVAHPNCSRSA